MKDYEFEAAKLIMSRSSRGTTDLARRVLVGGESMTAVGVEAKVSRQAISKLSGRVRAHLDTARKIQLLLRDNKRNCPNAVYLIGSQLMPLNAKGEASDSVKAAGEALVNGLSDREAAQGYGLTYQSVYLTRLLIREKYELCLDVAETLNQGDSLA